MSTQSTLGWSLLSSGIVTLIIGFLSLGDLFWGLLLVALGLGVVLAGRS